jgi:HAD superfamily hydrolase (TIGR01662 family)
MIEAVIFDFGDTLMVEYDDIKNIPLWEMELTKMDYADELLAELKKKYRLGLVSNTDQSGEKELRDALRRLGIEGYFDVVVATRDVGTHKPDPRPFKKALSALGVSPEKAVMIGDRAACDIFGAKCIGMKTILLRFRDRYPEPQDPAEEPDAKASSLREIPGIIEQISEKG